MWTDYVIPDETPDVESQLNEVLAKNETGLHIPYTDDMEATSKGLVITGNPDFHTWHSLWQWLKERDAAMPWILGDMMLYGELAFGEQASQVLDSEDEQTHFAPGTLKQYRYVANKWPQSSRLDLPWSYHQATAHLPIEQRMALMQHCVENDIKRAELRQLVRELNDGQNPNPPASLSDTNHELTEDNHKKDRRIAELEMQVAEYQQAVIMPEMSLVTTQINHAAFRQTVTNQLKRWQELSITEFIQNAGDIKNQIEWLIEWIEQNE